jgi:aminoglycoside phosphotransferase (APT) family kinase protein
MSEMRLIEASAAVCNGCPVNIAQGFNPSQDVVEPSDAAVALWREADVVPEQLNEPTVRHTRASYHVSDGQSALRSIDERYRPRDGWGACQNGRLLSRAAQCSRVRKRASAVRASHN